MKFYRDSLIWKLTKTISVLLLITTIIIGTIYAITFRHIFMEQMEREHEFILDQIDNNISNTLSDANIILDRLFVSMNLSYYLSGDNVLRDREIDLFIYNSERYLAFVRTQYNQKYSNVGVFSLNNQFDIHQHFWKYELEYLMAMDCYDEIVDSTELTVVGQVRPSILRLPIADSDIAMTEDISGEILPIYRKVYAHNPRRLVGVILIEIDISDVIESDVIISLPNNAYNMILDNNYNVLLDTLELSEEEQEVVRLAFIEDSNLQRLSLDRGRYLLNNRVCPYTNLNITVLTPEREVLVELFAQLGMILLIAVLFWFILVAIVFTFVRNALERLVILDRMMGKVGEGDFTVEVGEDGRKDEITRISHTFNEMAARLSSVLQEKVEYEQASKNAELRALQAQINPHFLNNTLENMRMQCEIDEYYSLVDNLSALSSMFRYSISWGSTQASLEEEFSNLSNYLEIMKMRFGDELVCNIQFDAEFGEIIVPKMMLQPLAENSFNHGFKQILPPWKLTVKTIKVDTGVQIIIADNGRGIFPQRLEYLKDCLNNNHNVRDVDGERESIGLINVKQRIDMICKQGSTFEIESSLGVGTTITINITQSKDKI